MAIKAEFPRFIAAEGKATQILLRHFLRHLRITGVQVEDFQGHPGFAGRLKQIRALSGFTENVQSFAVVRDAEQDANGAFQSVCDALQAAGLTPPSAPGEKTGSEPAVAIFLLPDNSHVGMLEDLCLASVAEDPAMACVAALYECLETRGVAKPANLSKARAQAFLATRPESGLAVGWAADENYAYWKWEHAAFKPLADFLRAL